MQSLSFKFKRKYLLYILLYFCISIFFSIFSDTIVLKSGDSIEGKVIELTPYSVKIQLSDQIENEIGMSDIIKITSRKLSPEEIQELFQKDKESTEKLSPKEIIEEKFFQLEDTIVVTASKKNQKIGDAPAIITVFTDKEIEDLGIQSMNELITFLPGFYSTNDLTRVPNRLSVRGIQNSTLILVDGIPIIQKNIVRGFNDFPITIASVKRVEVIRGPGSVTWEPMPSWELSILSPGIQKI